MKSKWIIELKTMIIFSGIIGLFFAFIAFIFLLIIKQSLIDALYTFVGVLFASFLASSILCSRDNRRRKKYIKNRPVEECIKDIEKIREYGESAPIELGKMKENIQQRNPDNERSWAWIDPVIEFNQRFGVLAASEDTTPEQAEALAEEVRQFVKQNKGKYPIAGYNLADLIRERNSKMKNCDSTPK